MCDYSLEGLPNRLAVAGEQLITYRFPTHSIGMASPEEVAASGRPKAPGSEPMGFWDALKWWFHPQMELERVCAVCIPPGARLRMSGIPERMKRRYGLRPVEEVTFVQLSSEPYRYRDAIRFADGREELLQNLPEGVPFQVVSLDLDEVAPEQRLLVLSE